MTGLNLQGQMNLAALAFGLTTVLTFFGAVLIVIGIVLLIIGVDIFFYHMRPKEGGHGRSNSGNRLALLALGG